MFTLNRITRVLRSEEAAVEGSAGAGADFNPVEITQGQGLFDMKAQAQEQELQQEVTGSVSVDEAPVDEAPVEQQEAAKATDEQPAAEEVSTSENATEESSEYTYNGVAVEVTNTPEMTAAFKDKGLDIDGVNKELYSKDGLTTETREKLNEAFGKLSVDMYLQGLESHNEAVLSQAKQADDNLSKEINAVIKEVAGDKFDDVMAWADKSLEPDEYNRYAAVINGDDSFQIKLALADLTKRAGLNQVTLSKPTVSVKEQLLGANNGEVQQTGHAIDGLTYRKALTSREYYKDPAGWDTRRQAGIDAGMV